MFRYYSDVVRRGWVRVGIYLKEIRSVVVVINRVNMDGVDGGGGSGGCGGSDGGSGRGVGRRSRGRWRVGFVVFRIERLFR